MTFKTSSGCLVTALITLISLPVHTQCCSGNPTFACCSGYNPICSGSGWTCNGVGSCPLSNFPTNCTAGQMPQCQCGGWWQCINLPGTPIVIDTAGKGFHFTSAEGGVKFDIDGNGVPVQIAWTDTTSGNAFLALDRDGDGKITSGRELFGNVTQQPSSSEPNGFLALAEFDKPGNGGNGDSVIDSRDAIYSKLLLWIDINHDGISQWTEIQSLADSRVSSISLA